MPSIATAELRECFICLDLPGSRSQFRGEDCTPQSRKGKREAWRLVRLSAGPGRNVA
jgi:hypothetical protein